MKANEIDRDELAAFLETDGGRAFLDGIDAKWSEAIEPMRRAGFILSAAGGAAAMCTYRNIVEAQGVEGAVRMLQMNGVEVPIGGSKQ
jgi:hypothetical protein